MHLFCKLFHHEFIIKKDITHYVKEYECIHCRKQFTTSDTGNLTPLTPKRREINSELKSLHKKRSQRTSYS